MNTVAKLCHNRDINQHICTYILPVHIIHNTKCFIQKQTFDGFFKNNIETTFHHSVKAKVYP